MAKKKILIEIEESQLLNDFKASEFKYREALLKGMGVLLGTDQATNMSLEFQNFKSEIKLSEQLRRNVTNDLARRIAALESILKNR